MTVDSATTATRHDRPACVLQGLRPPETKAPQQIRGAFFHSGGPVKSDGIQMTTTRVPTFTRS
jgi:hypothetical protein